MMGISLAETKAYVIIVISKINNMRFSPEKKLTNYGKSTVSTGKSSRWGAKATNIAGAHFYQGVAPFKLLSIYIYIDHLNHRYACHKP